MCKRTYVHTQVHVGLYVRTYVCMYVCMCMYVYVCVHVCMYACIYAGIRVCVRACVHPCLGACWVGLWDQTFKAMRFSSAFSTKLGNHILCLTHGKSLHKKAFLRISSGHLSRVPFPPSPLSPSRPLADKHPLLLPSVAMRKMAPVRGVGPFDLPIHIADGWGVNREVNNDPQWNRLAGRCSWVCRQGQVFQARTKKKPSWKKSPVKYTVLERAKFGSLVLVVCRGQSEPYILYWWPEGIVGMGTFFQRFTSLLWF